MRGAHALAIGFLPILLAGCGPEGPSKADTGLIVGGVAGGIIGNQVGKGSGNVLATVAGAVIGGIVGSEIGRSMDEQDRRLAQEAEFDALEAGESIAPAAGRTPTTAAMATWSPAGPISAAPPIAGITPTPSTSTATPRPCAAPPVAMATALGGTSPKGDGRNVA